MQYLFSISVAPSLAIIAASLLMFDFHIVMLSWCDTKLILITVYKWIFQQSTFITYMKTVHTYWNRPFSCHCTRQACRSSLQKTFCHSAINIPIYKNNIANWMTLNSYCALNTVFWVESFISFSVDALVLTWLF